MQDEALGEALHNGVGHDGRGLQMAPGMGVQPELEDPHYGYNQVREGDEQHPRSEEQYEDEQGNSDQEMANEEPEEEADYEEGQADQAQDDQPIYGEHYEGQEEMEAAQEEEGEEEVAQDEEQAPIESDEEFDDGEGNDAD